MMTRGFVTIATGSTAYYKMAYFLVLSYRMHNEGGAPFAIICDKENEFTKPFDKIIIMENPFFSYVDKISLPNIHVWDETIFIDADSLIYGNINHLFDVFDEKIVFSGHGHTRDANSNRSWFTKDGAGEYKELIDYSISLFGLAYYYKQCPALLEFNKVCVHILENFNSFKFAVKKPCDEAVFSLAMAVSGFHPVTSRKVNSTFETFTKSKSIKKMKIQSQSSTSVCRIIHFGNIHTHSSTYRYHTYQLNCLIQNKKIKRLYFRRFLWTLSYHLELVPFYWKIIVKKLRNS